MSTVAKRKKRKAECANCRFFTDAKIWGYQGYCYRYPPSQRTLGSGRYEWPVVRYGDHCGEHKFK